jgi:hypothetical protein
MGDDLRLMAADLGDVWIEKTEVATGAPAGDAPGEDTPLDGLVRGIAAMDLDGDLTDFVPEFETLRSRLPAELLAAGDPFAPDAGGMAVLRDEVRELLLARLKEARHAD